MVQLLLAFLTIVFISIRTVCWSTFKVVSQLSTRYHATRAVCESFADLACLSVVAGAILCSRIIFNRFYWFGDFINNRIQLFAFKM